MRIVSLIITLLLIWAVVKVEESAAAAPASSADYSIRQIDDDLMIVRKKGTPIYIRYKGETIFLSSAGEIRK